MSESRSIAEAPCRCGKPWNEHTSEDTIGPNHHYPVIPLSDAEQRRVDAIEDEAARAQEFPRTPPGDDVAAQHRAAEDRYVAELAGAAAVAVCAGPDTGLACVVCGYDRAEHEGDGEMVHDFRADTGLAGEHRAASSAAAYEASEGQYGAPIPHDTGLPGAMLALAEELEAEAGQWSSVEARLTGRDAAHRIRAVVGEATGGER